MPVSYVAVETLDISGHHFRTVCPSDYDGFLVSTATEYIQLRTRCAVPLEDVSVEGIQVLSVEQLRQRLTSATIPVRRPRSNFDVVRSDFGETLCYMVLEQEYGTKFGYKSVSDRETIQQPGRGIDAVGVEDGDPLTIVLSEVKVSDDSSSPPGVVDSSSDCLRNQHLAHIGNIEVTIKKIWDLARKTLDKAIRNKLFLAASLLEEENTWSRLRLVACCVLVRPNSKYTSNDFGSFCNQPTDYIPANLRFWIVCVPHTIETVIEQWYRAIEQTEV